MEGLELALRGAVSVYPAHGILMGPDPFNWLRLESVESKNGLSIGTVLFCMFRATQFGHGSEFGKFLDDMPHQEDDHVHEGYYEPDEDSVFTKLHDSIELWSLEKHGWLEQFFKLFTVQTHDKDGCRDCFGHFSEPQVEYVLDAGNKPIELFMQQTTTEASNLCSCCGHPTRYDRKSFRHLPMCLVFTHTGLPLLELQYREVPYKLSVVIPEVDKSMAYVLSENEWAEIHLKENKTAMKPLDTMDEWSGLELVFYTKVICRGACCSHMV